MNSRCILITGATGKIGRVLVKYFLDNGNKVVAVGKSFQSLSALRDEHKLNAKRLSLIECDLLESGAVELIQEKLNECKLTPDCLINNARNRDHLRLNKDGIVDREQFLNEVVLGFVVPYELTMSMVNSSNSALNSVVNIGSQYGSVVPNLHLYSTPSEEVPIHYGVAKAGLAHLTKELAVRLASRKVRVNCVSFGGVDGRVTQDFKDRYALLCPNGRMLYEEEVPPPVDFMLSNFSSGITGHILNVDGGWTLW